MRLVHEFDKAGWHRVVIDFTTGLPPINGQWAPPNAPATLDARGRRFAALVDYWNNAVVEIKTVDDLPQDILITKENRR